MMCRGGGITADKYLKGINLAVTVGYKYKRGALVGCRCHFGYM